MNKWETFHQGSGFPIVRSSNASGDRVYDVVRGYGGDLSPCGRFVRWDEEENHRHELDQRSKFAKITIPIFYRKVKFVPGWLCALLSRYFAYFRSKHPLGSPQIDLRAIILADSMKDPNPSDDPRF